jgi:hypothetical protein
LTPAFSFVIASVAKQYRAVCAALDCFVATLLAMTSAVVVVVVVVAPPP